MELYKLYKMIGINKISKIEKILEIETEIKQIKRNPSYMKIINILKIVETRIGNVVMIIPSPDDLKTKMEVRRHSPEMKDIIHRYNKRQLEYEKKIKNLYDQKHNIEKKIFARAR